MNSRVFSAYVRGLLLTLMPGGSLPLAGRVFFYSKLSLSGVLVRIIWTYLRYIIYEWDHWWHRISCIIWHDRHASVSVQKKVVYGYCINHPCTRKAKSLLFGTVAYAFGMRVVAKHSNKQSPTFFSFGRLRASLVRKKKKKRKKIRRLLLASWEGTWMALCKGPMKVRFIHRFHIPNSKNSSTAI